MADETDFCGGQRPRLELIGGTQACGRRRAAKADFNPSGDDAIASLISDRKFHVIFKMSEHPGGPWGDCGAWGDSFRGSYGLTAIVEILRAFDANGVCLTCWFLEDEIGAEAAAVDEEMEKLRKGGPRRWRVIYSVCPMLFAAAKGLDRAVGAALNAQHFKPMPNQRLNGTPAFGMALRGGWRSDIAMLLLMAEPRRETVDAALAMLRERRDETPDDDHLHQRVRADAVEAMLMAELEEGEQYWEGVSGDDDARE